MTFFDGHQFRRVYQVQPSDNPNISAHHLGFAYTNGWCSLTYYVTEYSTLPQNRQLTAYLRKNYPEYFI